MKIAIVGAGIIGVTTAYELAADGHTVSVFDQRGATAEETSFAPAGIVSPGYLRAWPAPGLPRGPRQFVWRKPDQLSNGSLFAGDTLSWALKRRQIVRASRHAPADNTPSQLAQFSRDRLAFLTTELQLDYDRSAGYTVLLKSERENKFAQPGIQVLKDAGVPVKVLSPSETCALETALNPDAEFYGSIHLPNDLAANTRQIALLLRAEAQRLGANFEFNSSVVIDTRASSQVQVKVTANGEQSVRNFDAVVLCTGSHARESLRQIDEKIPLINLHGLSISATIREPLNAPRSALLDPRTNTSIVRLGNRVRVSGGAHAGPIPEATRKTMLLSMYRVLQEWFPGAAHMSSGVQEWEGAYATTVDALPVVGASGKPNVWLNLGHGTSGGMNAFGSARILADLIAGREAGFGTETSPDSNTDIAFDRAKLAASRFAG